MKIYKITALLIALCFLCLPFVACDDETPQDTVKYVTVTLDYNDGRPLHTVRVESGKTMTRPIDPEREGYTFGGWKTNGKDWSFEEHAVINDMTFVATWINASSLFDYVLNSDGAITLVSYTGSLSAVNIPEIISGNTIGALGDGIFASLDGRVPTEISIPATVTSVGKNALSGATISKITVGGRLTSIGESAFSGCTGLAQIGLGEGLEIIPYDAFSSTSIRTVDIPESVRVIDENAFYNCAELKTVVLPRGVEIKNAAFSGCNSLVTVFFLGNEAEWQEVLAMLDNGGGENDAILSARVLFYSETEPEAEGEFWYRNKDGEPRGW